MRVAQACGKFILGGEHSVVHRGRALAFPLSSLKLEFLPKDSLSENETAGLWINGVEQDSEELERITQLCTILGASQGPIRIEIRSQIPMGSGLGSSAALCTAIARHYSDHKLEGNPLALKALEGEKLFHGNPSGIDPFTVALGRPILFSGRDISWREVPLQKLLEQKLCFVLFDSGKTHSTIDVQRQVTATRSETPLIWEDLIDSLSSNVEHMLKALENDPKRDLGRIMNDSHFRLVQLGVSNDTLNSLADAVRALPGALGAKLTGAGCGGYILGLFQTGDDTSENDLRRKSFEGRLKRFDPKCVLCWPEL